MRKPIAYLTSLTVFSLLVALSIPGRDKPKPKIEPTQDPAPTSRQIPEPIADPPIEYSLFDRDSYLREPPDKVTISVERYRN